MSSLSIASRLITVVNDDFLYCLLLFHELPIHPPLGAPRTTLSLPLSNMSTLLHPAP